MFAFHCQHLTEQCSKLWQTISYWNDNVVCSLSSGIWQINTAQFFYRKHFGQATFWKNIRKNVNGIAWFKINAMQCNAKGSKGWKNWAKKIKTNHREEWQILDILIKIVTFSLLKPSNYVLKLIKTHSILFVYYIDMYNFAFYFI